MKKGVIALGILWFTLSSLSLSAAYIYDKGTPDFMILGVTKCGTSSLYSYLVKHPKILGAVKKELHFFDTGRFGKGLASYRQLFPKKNSRDELIGEGTPGYFWKKPCARRIFEYCPTTKFIVIFRNPVKRVISEYFRLKRRGEETLDFDQAILQPGMQGRYIGAGLYIEHLERWLSLFPRKQFLVLILEDMAQNPEQEVNKVFKFLGLKERKLDSYEIVKQAKYNMKKIKPETIEELKNFYEPYNKRLEKFLGRKLPW